MQRPPGFLSAFRRASFVALVLASACSTSGGSSGGGTGGRSTGATGGAAVASGGTTGVGSGGSNAPATGGVTGSGGVQSGSGGAGTPGSGGATGGAAAATGGAAAATGGGGAAGGNTGSTGGSGVAGAAGMAGARGSGGAMAATGGAVACAAPIPVNTGTAATVMVNIGAAPMATVSGDLMGVHTAVYDGLLTTTPTTTTLLQAAGVTSLRYPGGSYADLYHWELNTGDPTPAAGFGSNTIYVAPTANFGSFVRLLQSVGANALITVNYGMNSSATGPGDPKEAAAWVAYANGMPGDTKVIGVDNSTPPVDFMTVGYWATLRASAPLAVDDGKNFLRINRLSPVGIKYWEVGNELYGNGFYNGGAGSAGWEADLHAPYNGTDGTARRNNASLSPATYGQGVAAFATAMKAVDPTIQIGGIVNWPDTSYAGFNSGVLARACASMDFAVAHWYPGSTIASLLTAPRNDLPALHTGIRGLLMTNCPAGSKGATMPIAITEWGPNFNVNNQIRAALITAVPAIQTQIVGLFAAEAYAHFMEQGTLSAHWAQLHDASYLGDQSTDTGWGYHGAVMAHRLASGGDRMLPPPVSSAPTLLAHASKHADGSVSVMLTNTSATAAANVTFSVTGGALGCVGRRSAYTPAAGSTDLDGAVTTSSIFSSSDGLTVPIAVPAYSVVVVAFPLR